MSALRHFCARYPEMTKGSSLPGGSNPTVPGGSLSGWVCRDYFGLDQGIVVLMIENYRSGLMWKLIRLAPGLSATPIDRSDRVCAGIADDCVLAHGCAPLFLSGVQHRRRLPWGVGVVEDDPGMVMLRRFGVFAPLEPEDSVRQHDDGGERGGGHHLGRPLSSDPL